jgi:hypothetical protein
MNTGNSVQEADERRVVTAYELPDPGLSDSGLSDSRLSDPALADPVIGDVVGADAVMADAGLSDLGGGLPDLETAPEAADEAPATGAGSQGRVRSTRTPPSFQHVRDIQELIDKLDAVTRQLRDPGHS